MKIELSFDDGNPLDSKVVEVLKNFDFPATFYIPSNSMLTGNEIESISKKYEIGGHTASHIQDLKLLGNKDLKQEIVDNKHYLEFLILPFISLFCLFLGFSGENMALLSSFR